MKKFLLPMLAVLLAAVLSAFTLPEKVNNTEPLWYYTGTTVAQHGNQNFYELLDEQDVSVGCPGETQVRCVIEAPEDGNSGKPNLNAITRVVSFKP